MQLTIRGELITVNATADDLSLGDAEAVEKITGSTLGELNFKSMSAAVALIFVSARSTFPDLKLAEVRALKMSAIRQVADVAEGPADPAVPAADGDDEGGEPDPS